MLRYEFAGARARAYVCVCVRACLHDDVGPMYVRMYAHTYVCIHYDSVLLYPSLDAPRLNAEISSREAWCKSEVSTHTVSYICIYVTKHLKSKLFNTLQPDWPKHDSPAACVIVQKYSSASFLSLCFHSRKEKLRGAFQKMLFLRF